MEDDDLDRDRLLGALYDELRGAAARLLRREAPDITLQATELANEAAIRILKLDRMSWHDRHHFFATGALILRQAMIDAIRRKRGAKRQAPTLVFTDDGAGMDAERLDESLKRLALVSPELAHIVELRFFVGLGIEEVAAVTDLSERTVKRKWQTARLWLADDLAA